MSCTWWESVDLLQVNNLLSNRTAWSSASCPVTGDPTLRLRARHRPSSVMSTINWQPLGPLNQLRYLIQVTSPYSSPRSLRWMGSALLRATKEILCWKTKLIWAILSTGFPLRLVIAAIRPYPSLKNTLND